MREGYVRLRFDVGVGIGGLSGGGGVRCCSSSLSSSLEAEMMSSKSEFGSGSDSESVGGPGMSAGMAGNSVLGYVRPRDI